MPSSTSVAALAAEAIVGRYADDIAEVWGRTMPAGPERLRERVEVILPRHVERDGFRFFGALDGDGPLVGFGYGYEGAPGQWWHDRVAGALGAEGAERWLPAGHFELVELHVRPDRQGRGLGGELHDRLLDGLRCPTAVLTTQRDNTRALGLYHARGWRIIVDVIQFGPEFPPYSVLGKDLPAPYNH